MHSLVQLLLGLLLSEVPTFCKSGAILSVTQIFREIIFSELMLFEIAFVMNCVPLYFDYGEIWP